MGGSFNRSLVEFFAVAAAAKRAVALRPADLDGIEDRWRAIFTLTEPFSPRRKSLGISSATAERSAADLVLLAHGHAAMHGSAEGLLNQAMRITTQAEFFVGRPIGDFQQALIESGMLAAEERADAATEVAAMLLSVPPAVAFQDVEGQTIVLPRGTRAAAVRRILRARDTLMVRAGAASAATLLAYGRFGDEDLPVLAAVLAATACAVDGTEWFVVPGLGQGVREEMRAVLQAAATEAEAAAGLGAILHERGILPPLLRRVVMPVGVARCAIDAVPAAAGEQPGDCLERRGCAPEAVMSPIKTSLAAIVRKGGAAGLPVSEFREICRALNINPNTARNYIYRAGGGFRVEHARVFLDLETTSDEASPERMATTR